MTSTRLTCFCRLLVPLVLLAPAAAGASDGEGSSHELPTGPESGYLLPLESGLVPLEVTNAGPLEIDRLRYSPTTGELSFALVNWGPEIVTAYGVELVYWGSPGTTGFGRNWEHIDSVPPAPVRLYPGRRLGDDSGYLRPFDDRQVTLGIAPDKQVSKVALGVSHAVLGDGSVYGDRQMIELLLAARQRDREALERWLAELRRLLAEAGTEAALVKALRELAPRLRAAVPAENWLTSDFSPEAEPQASGAIGSLYQAIETATTAPEDCTGRRAAICDSFAPSRFVEDVLAHFEERLTVLRQHAGPPTPEAPARGAPAAPDGAAPPVGRR